VSSPWLAWSTKEKPTGGVTCVSELRHARSLTNDLDQVLFQPVQPMFVTQSRYVTICCG
jgi:hypothetical protein